MDLYNGSHELYRIDATGGAHREAKVSFLSLTEETTRKKENNDCNDERTG